MDHVFGNDEPTYTESRMKSKLCFAIGIAILCVAPFCLGLHDTLDGGLKGISGSAPPGIGGNGPFESYRMDLLSNLPLSSIGGGTGNVLGSDCWGWTHQPSGREFALCCLTNATSFIEITDPSNPQYLGKLLTTTGNSSWRDLKVYNDHCFIVSDGNGAHGMQVFDLTQLLTADPGNPQNFSVTTLYTNITSAHNIAINEDTGYAYIVGATQNSGGLHVVDISTPSNPAFAGAFEADGYTHDAQIIVYDGPDAAYQGREIAFASNEDTLTIVDVTNKNNMVQVSRNGYAQDGYTHQSWITEDHRYVYLCDELDETAQGGPTRTHIWDCQDLDNPIYLGFHGGTNESIDHNLYIQGNRIYLASYSAGLRVLEIGAQPDDLTEIAFFDTFVTDDDTDFDGAWSCYPFFPSGNILVNDRQNGMFIVRLSPLEFAYPSGRPELVDPSGGDTFTVEVTGFAGIPQSGTGVLHVDRGNGFEAFPMTEVAANVYEAVFPATNCGSEVRYYVSAQATDGTTINSPSNAPQVAYTVLSGDGIQVTASDDFETNRGWSVAGDATDGQWERGIPAGDGNRGDPPVDGDGSGQCYLTDNVSGNSDVDGGATVLTSPALNGAAVDGVATFVSYYRWYSNDLGNAPASDVMDVEISNDNGETWTLLERVGPGGSEVSGGWFFKRFKVDDIMIPTNLMKLRFTASDLGDGSVVEAAVDGIKFESIICDSIATPQTYNLVRGFLDAGDLADLETSNDVGMLFRKQPGLSRTRPVTVVFDGTLSGDTPTSLTFNIECQASGVGLRQNVLLYNWSTSQFDLIGQDTLQTTDQVFTHAVSNVQDYVQPGTGNVRAQLGYEPKLNSLLGRQQWTVEMDQVFWE